MHTHNERVERSFELAQCHDEVCASGGMLVEPDGEAEVLAAVTLL